MTLYDAFNLAVQRLHSGQSAEAIGMLQQILAVEINDSAVWHQLGVTAHTARWSEAAVELFSRALTLASNSAVLLSNLGHVLSVVGRLDEGVAACRRAIKIQPDYA